jgi:hypothetical protein
MPKPISTGIRVDALCDSSTGYCDTFQVDQRNMPTHDKAVALISRLKAKGHRIVFDDPKVAWRYRIHGPWRVRNLTCQFARTGAVEEYQTPEERVGER